MLVKHNAVLGCSQPVPTHFQIGRHARAQNVAMTKCDCDGLCQWTGDKYTPKFKGNSRIVISDTIVVQQLPPYGLVTLFQLGSQHTVSTIRVFCCSLFGPATQYSTVGGIEISRHQQMLHERAKRPNFRHESTNPPTKGSHNRPSFF